MDYDRARHMMVERQLKARGIKDARVLEAFMKVPRHEFVADELRPSAYADYPLPIGEGQTISQPYMAALMTECLRLKNTDKVLEIGTGSGYQLAILLELAREACSVERMEQLAYKAEELLKRLGYANFRIKTGDGTLGWEECGPYDAIIVTAAAPAVPRSLPGQLKDGGRLVVPVGGAYGQTLTVISKRGQELQREEICGCVFVPLVGKEGWNS